MRKVNERIPIPKATTVPTRVIPSSWMVPTFSSSNTVAPKIAGIERRKENFAESSRSRPVRSPVDMVAPDLEMPGMMAIPWAIPIRTESNHLIFMMFLPSFLVQRVTQRKEPVIRSIPPTSFGWEKKDSNQSLKRKPMRPVGMVASIIQRRSLIPCWPLPLPLEASRIP